MLLGPSVLTTVFFGGVLMLKTNPFGGQMCEVARFGALSLPGADSVRPGLGDLHVLSSFRRYGWLQPLQAARPSEAAGCGGWGQTIHEEVEVGKSFFWGGFFVRVFIVFIVVMFEPS